MENINCSRSNKTLSDGHLEKKTQIEIWPFVCFFEAEMVILGPIDFLFGLPTNLNVNDGQNKFEVDICKHVAKIG